ncbi:peptidoglycan-binding protein [Streptomyces sp. NPDC090445]|uniref:peptidoglycan-binding domain-containing protein n=1 Tax=Streptomyces sp. NPDC090445 TaxID=3365963 RepID=UPI00382A1C3B
MSHHPDDSGPAPEDPALAPAGPAPAADPAMPAWPEAGPQPAPGPQPEAGPQPAPGPWPEAGPQPEAGQAAAAFDASWSAHGREEPADTPGPEAATAPAAARSGRRHARHGRPDDRRRDRGSRLPWAAGSLLLLGAAGVLALWPGDSEPENERSTQRPDLSVPELPGSNPGADGSPTPTPSARGTASPSPSPSPSASPSEKPPAPSTSAATPPGQRDTLRMGDRGPDVTALQQLLYGQGFTYVHVSGVYDGQTKRGVAQLQRDRDVKGDPTGVYGPATRAAFGG